MPERDVITIEHLNYYQHAKIIGKTKNLKNVPKPYNIIMPTNTSCAKEC